MQSTRREGVRILGERDFNMSQAVKVWLAAILFAAWANTGVAFASKQSPLVDAPAPDFEVTTIA
jgi:hypothetical protein